MRYEDVLKNGLKSCDINPNTVVLNTHKVIILNGDLHVALHFNSLRRTGYKH